MSIWVCSVFPWQQRGCYRMESDGLFSGWADRFRSVLLRSWWRAGEMQIWSEACRRRNLASLLLGRSERRWRTWQLIGFWGDLRWVAMLAAARRRCDPWRWPVAGVWRWWSFSDGLCWMVKVEGDRVGLWSQCCEWLVKPSVELMFGRRWMLLEVLTERLRFGLVTASCWRWCLFRCGAFLHSELLQNGCMELCSRRLGLGSLCLFHCVFLLWLLHTLLLVLFLVAFFCQLSNKSILYGVMVVVVDSGDRIDLGCWLVVIRIQSYPVCVLGFHYQPVLRRKGDSGIARPIVFYWFVPILVIATYFGPICASSGSIRSWLLNPLTRHSLFIGVRIVVLVFSCLFFGVNPSGCCDSVYLQF